MARPEVRRKTTGIPGVRKVTRTYDNGRRVTKYEVRVKDAAGRLENVGTYDNLPDARAAITDARKEVKDGRHVSRSAGAVRFLAVAEAWLGGTAGKSLKPSTRSEYDRVLRTHLAPLHDIAVNRLDYGYLDKFMAGLMDGRSAATVRYIRHVLRSVLDHAVRSGYLAANPARNLATEDMPKYRVDLHLQADSIGRLIAALPAPWDLLVETAAKPGSAPAS